VTKGNPDPEPYLTAMNKLAVPAPACLVIENARLGIRSAKAAGCTCYALETTLAAGHLLEADEVFPSHNELLERLRTVFDQDF
jgi:beta-phosphoglucomutase-like phosphatase (HAD superfamily)